MESVRRWHSNARWGGSVSTLRLPVSTATRELFRVKPLTLLRRSDMILRPARFVHVPRDASAVRKARGNRINLRVSILASGSSGNCTLLETSRTRLLVDAGLGKKETLRRLAAIEQSVDRLDAIVISHEHSDHIGGLAHLLGEWRTTIYLTAATHFEVVRTLTEKQLKRFDRAGPALFSRRHRSFALRDSARCRRPAGLHVSCRRRQAGRRHRPWLHA
jgi:hypothetical protein